MNLLHYYLGIVFLNGDLTKDEERQIGFREQTSKQGLISNLLPTLSTRSRCCRHICITLHHY